MRRREMSERVQLQPNGSMLRLLQHAKTKRNKITRKQKKNVFVPTPAASLTRLDAERLETRGVELVWGVRQLEEEKEEEEVG